MVLLVLQPLNALEDTAYTVSVALQQLIAAILIAIIILEKVAVIVLEIADALIPAVLPVLHIILPMVAFPTVWKPPPVFAAVALIIPVIVVVILIALPVSNAPIINAPFLHTVVTAFATAENLVQVARQIAEIVKNPTVLRVATHQNVQAVTASIISVVQYLFTAGMVIVIVEKIVLVVPLIAEVARRKR